MSVQMPLALTK